MAKRVSKDDFDKEVLQSELPVIVDLETNSHHIRSCEMQSLDLTEKLTMAV